MGNINVEIEDNLHNELRHKAIDEKKEIREIVVIALKKYLKKNV